VRSLLAKPSEVRYIDGQCVVTRYAKTAWAELKYSKWSLVEVHIYSPDGYIRQVDIHALTKYWLSDEENAAWQAIRPREEWESPCPA